MGVEPAEHVRIKAGERIAANNRTLTAPEGGFTLIRKGKLREVSVVSLGADNRTSVAIAAMKGTDMNEEDIRAQERERLAKITALCDGDWGKDGDRVDALKARAISGEISEFYRVATGGDHGGEN